jgi:hypothetical protein
MENMNLLRHWLLDNERSCSWLARQCDVSPVAVHFWVTETHEPSGKNKESIYQATGVVL